VLPEHYGLDRVLCVVVVVVDIGGGTAMVRSVCVVVVVVGSGEQAPSSASVPKSVAARVERTCAFISIMVVLLFVS
jgi:hypothetical protein